MGRRRRRTSLNWQRRNGGAVADTEIGQYIIEATARGVVARFESDREVTGLGCYLNVERARARAERHHVQMKHYLRSLDRLTLLDLVGE